MTIMGSKPLIRLRPADPSPCLAGRRDMPHWFYLFEMSSASFPHPALDGVRGLTCHIVLRRCFIHDHQFRVAIAAAAPPRATAPIRFAIRMARGVRNRSRALCARKVQVKSIAASVTNVVAARIAHS